MARADVLIDGGIDFIDPSAPRLSDRLLVRPPLPPAAYQGTFSAGRNSDELRESRGSFGWCDPP